MPVFRGPAAGPALLIVGHGTRSAEGVSQFVAHVNRIRAIAKVDVAGGFIELSEPPLADAVAELVAAGHRRVVAIPLVLVAAGHSKGDIPAALKRESLRHPGLTFEYGRPLSGHPTILNLLTERLDTVLSFDKRIDTAVLLVGRGTTDPDANADVARVARLFWEGRTLQMVEPAFVSLAEPSVLQGLNRCRALGAKRIVVLPYFLFSGVLPERVITQARSWGEENQEVELQFADLIGDCLPLAGLVLERYAEALSGHVRVNCDACLYRIALPGFESRVGAAQHPHDHPLDPTGIHEH